MITFQNLGLQEEILTAVTGLGYELPMPIQEQVIPFIMSETSDLVAMAQTGTGKTAAFGLPILNMVDPDNQSIQALILAPTRELCVQISNDLKSYSRLMPQIKVVPVYGGESIVTQMRQLEQKPQILVATPGRLIDFIERKKIKLDNIQFLVLDEADEMLNMGFQEAIETILSTTPKDRRTLLFSATMPAPVFHIAKKYMNHYCEISVGNRNAGADNVEHKYYVVQARNRYLALKRIVDMNPDIYGIVFCHTRQETKEIADKLMRDGYDADALHGDLSQMQRDLVMNKFRLRNLQILVATDVAARGLDVSDLTHVINYNLPDDNEIYTHRSGRTGRANKSGISISIIHTKEVRRLHEIAKLVQKEFKQEQIPSGMEVCKRQLFFLIDRMENVQVNNELIDPLLTQIYKKLEYLDKDEIIKRFVSVEFNRFLDYYKDAEDLNVMESDRSERYDKKEGRQGKQKGERSSQRSNRVRLKINVGMSQNASPRSILDLINTTTKEKINVGKIEVSSKNSFFEIYDDQLPKVLGAFNRNGGNGLMVSVAEDSGRNFDGGNSRYDFHEKRSFRSDKNSKQGSSERTFRRTR
jgi:ATP-dependent RNA helicase DeaD